MNKIRKNKLGKAGFTLSLIALLVGWIPYVGTIGGGVLWILGITFSIIGMLRSPRNLALAGLIISLVTVAVYVAVFVIAGTALVGYGLFNY
ncbi:MAG: hypothetical protein LBV69_01610 [Bacteroidales bacterium]|jgi:hypothetical protein|nr:hypothetical protein [Bacteroidales bacterium]